MREESVAGIMVPIIQLLLWPARFSEAPHLLQALQDECKMCMTV